MTDAEVVQLKANVRILLDNDRPLEAIRLLEEAVERAGRDAVLALQLRHLLGAALFYTPNSLVQLRFSTPSDATTGDICRRPTSTSSTARTTPATPTLRSASRTWLCPSCGSTYASCDIV